MQRPRAAGGVEAQKGASSRLCPQCGSRAGKEHASVALVGDRWPPLALPSSLRTAHLEKGIRVRQVERGPTEHLTRLLTCSCRPAPPRKPPASSAGAPQKLPATHSALSLSALVNSSSSRGR